MFDLTDKIEPAEVSKGEWACLSLMQAGMEEFAKNSLEGARIREIAHRAGQNVASVNYYFGGKRELYLEIVKFMVGYMKGRLEDDLCACGEFFERDPQLPEDYERGLELLKGLHRGLIRAIVGEEKTISITMIILREQVNPTEAFEIIYEEFIHHMHRMVTLLVSFLRELDADSMEARILAHSLLGQIFGFRAARESILRGTRQERITGEMAEQIEKTILDNLERQFHSKPSAK